MLYVIIGYRTYHCGFIFSLYEKHTIHTQKYSIVNLKTNSVKTQYALKGLRLNEKFEKEKVLRLNLPLQKFSCNHSIRSLQRCKINEDVQISVFRCFNYKRVQYLPPGVEHLPCPRFHALKNRNHRRCLRIWSGTLGESH